MGLKAKRFWEIDSLRGIAILMMIVFHFLFDFNYFANADVAVSSGFWLYFARATASLFILLVGISLTLSYSRAEKNNNALFSKYLKRGIKIFLWGFAITIITFVFLRQGYVIFGILHFIGISIILSYPLIKKKIINLLLGGLLVISGLFLFQFTFSFRWLLWLGFIPKNLYTLDYFPLLPWFGLILIGIFLGNTLYSGYRRTYRIPDFSDFALFRILSFLGRHSLLIYLLHQPVLIFILYFMGVVSF